MNAVHRMEAWALRSVIRLSCALGPVSASNLGARIARAIGPLLAVSRVADANLRLAMPYLTLAERSCIVRGVWDNLGRTAAELPHLAALHASADGPGWEIQGDENLQAVRARGGPALFFSGHLANWELIGPAVAELGIAMAGFYRAASNPLTNEIIQNLRREARGGQVRMFAKGARGARAALTHLELGGFLGMLMDQKMNDGIPVTFFGHDAMTAPALAYFALRFRCPVIPIHVERIGPARFRLICEAPLTLPETGDRATDAKTVMLDVNRTVEGWIRGAPESWLWLHRRWPSDLWAHGPARN